MPEVVIENPILNSAFEEPTRHFKFTDVGITDQIIKVRRKSTYFIPVPKPKKKGKQLTLESSWTNDRIQRNENVDNIRARVAAWRLGKYAGITPTTRRLLEHWKHPERARKLFFCQIEALETTIYITEVASKFGDGWIADKLRDANDQANPGLPRMALKMATGSGKTVVMAMLIAWQTLNKLANPQDTRFGDSFLIVTPGITIRDRLRVLLPNDPQNYYRALDLVPNDLFEKLHRTKILITNYHSFLLKEKLKAPKLTKKFLNPSEEGSLFKENPNEMVRRVCNEFGTKKQLIVINDEAHHCYRRKPDGEDVALDTDERRDAKKREEEARIWISGIEAIQRKIGVKVVYDLSATPFFLRGSGYSEGTLFPWVVSDFSLIDAIESGIVKVPRVPVADNAMTDEMPKYRELWLHIKDSLPKKGRGTESVAGGDPKLPGELQGAIHTLYTNYEKAYQKWESSDARQRGQTPPVFIVVCNNTNVSKLVYDYIAGYEKPAGDQTVLVPGALSIFSNVQDRQWLHRPNTILVDSEQLESGEAMTAEFKKMAAREIEEFKHEYRLRFPGKDVEKLTDEDILREVMNTVGKPGKLGENVKCVVSVSMLTEGWDANTVTHILGVRAFGTQLLCEQVVGRGLRRTNYDPNEDGKFDPEYAEVYGVPFSFIPCSGSSPDPKPPKPTTRVHAMKERAHLEIRFPRLLGYKFEVPAEKLTAKFEEESVLTLSTQDIPTKVEVEPIAGMGEVHTLDDLKRAREQQVAFFLAKKTLERYFPDAEGCSQVHLFPQVLRIAREWLEGQVRLKDNTFKQLLLVHERASQAADKIYRSIVRGSGGEPLLKPILQPYDTWGSTKYVDFNTSKPTWVTSEDKCHISHVVSDSGWEQKMAQVLEDIPEVVCYARNENLGFKIPYTVDGEERNYYPDFIAVIAPLVPEPHHTSPITCHINLVIEVSGYPEKDKDAKVATAKTMWVPAVNNHGGLGEWRFLEVKDPWNCQGDLFRVSDGEVANG
ncbi:MAG: hypothetical protein CNCCGFBP_01215 [Fimbriimonadaceae bacterium]|nr:hypothetical protein [Fimbriimonadaceae bacterium]